MPRPPQLAGRVPPQRHLTRVWRFPHSAVAKASFSSTARMLWLRSRQIRLGLLFHNLDLGSHRSQSAGPADRHYPVEPEHGADKGDGGHWQQWPAWSLLSQGVPGCGLAGQGAAGRGVARRGLAWQGRRRTSLKTAQRQAHSLSVFGPAARPGLAGHGLAGLGWARAQTSVKPIQ